MRRILDGCRTSRSIGVCLLCVYVVTIGVLVVGLTLSCTLSGQTFLQVFRLPAHLLAILLAVVAVWMTAHVRRLVPFGSGAGFGVAALGLLGCWSADFLPVGFGLDPRYPWVDRALTPPLAILRNMGLVAYAYGIALVALSSWTDWRLRRVAPAWVASHK